MVEKLIDFLLKTQNTDGGWGVVPGKRSQTDATALALLGLGSVKDRALSVHMDKGLQWLTNQQKADGSWPVTTQVTESSWSTSFAVLTLTVFGVQIPQALRGAQWILEQKGQTLGWRESIQYRWAPETMVTLLNPDLQGWSWVPSSFSWVEPTAYALIALKKLRPVLDDRHTRGRIRQGELLLYDRMCEDGGWNYGNKLVLGEKLPPYPDTTAIALIALQEQQAEAKNQKSLQVLVDLLGQTHSGLTLSWAIFCAVLYGLETSKWRALLSTVYEKTGFLNETKSLALALLALVDEHAFAFRV
jgi:hypothetical protein